MNLDNPSRTWLANLQAGTEIAVEFRGRKSEYFLANVERVTATQIIVRSGGRAWRFRRNDGREVGNHYGPYRMKELDEHIQRLLNKQRINREFDKAVGGVSHRCPLDTVEKLVMLDALNEYRKKGASV